jgi:hypothetical protein
VGAGCRGNKNAIWQALFHTGNNEGWHNYFIAYPEKNTAVIFLSNSLNFGHAADKLLKLTIGDTLSPLKWPGIYDHAK